MEEFSPNGGMGRYHAQCKTCRNTEAKTTSFTPYLHKGGSSKGVGLLAFMKAKARYHQELRLIKACGLDGDNMEDKPEIHKMLKIMIK